MEQIKSSLTRWYDWDIQCITKHKGNLLPDTIIFFPVELFLIKLEIKLLFARKDMILDLRYMILEERMSMIL